MTTRRDLLRSIPALMALRTVKGADVPYMRFDTHTHTHNHVPALIESLEKGNWKILSICDSREVGDQKSVLQEMTEGTIDAVRQSRGRIAWCTTFDARYFEDKDFTSKAIARVKEHFGQGAIAVKIWKNIGMAIKSKKGEFLMPDHKSLLPIYETIQKEGKTLISHMADLNAAWEDPATNPVGGGFYKENPEWLMFGKAGVPAKETILNARDRVIAKFPKLRVVGCHIGSNEQNLDLLAKRFDKYPNFAVDLASRISYLTRDFDKAREFLLKYQDRIIYGTDTSPARAANGYQNLQSTHDREFKTLASSEVMQEKKGAATKGFGLPERVVQKIFHDNAARWIHGMAT